MVITSASTPEESLSTRISLSFSAKNLLDRDVFSKSDPVCVVFLSTGLLQGDVYRECGRTEIIRNSLNPEWMKTVEIDYFFEEIQNVKFEIYDIDSLSSELSKHDFLGRAEATVAEIVGSPYCTKKFPLRGEGGKRGGELTVTAEEVDDASKELIQFICKGSNLDKKDFFGKSDPFLQIYKVNEDGSQTLVHRTEVIKKTLNPVWSPFEISSKRLCGGNKERLLRFMCYDHDFNGGHDFIGCCESTLAKLLSKKDTELPLINEKKRKKKGEKYLNSGTLSFASVITFQDHSFLEYIAGGTELDFFVAIDLTASNGRVTDPTSLHYIGSNPNEYHIAIRAVSDICQHYNNSKAFTVVGFGAKIPPNNRLSHCFPLMLNQGAYTVHGVDGLLQAYSYCLSRCVLYGPTHFSPVINEAARRASEYPRDGSRYQILLIITDGCINDFDQTLSAIVSASYLPLSIIIVGVGSDDFSRMTQLDADNQLLSFQGVTAQRDIVQFVPMREFLGEHGISSPVAQSVSAMAHLAKEVLAEVPLQLTSYMKINNIKPRPPNNPFTPTETTPHTTTMHPNDWDIPESSRPYSAPSVQTSSPLHTGAPYGFRAPSVPSMYPDPYTQYLQTSHIEAQIPQSSYQSSPLPPYMPVPHLQNYPPPYFQQSGYPPNYPPNVTPPHNPRSLSPRYSDPYEPRSSIPHTQKNNSYPDQLSYRNDFARMSLSDSRPPAHPSAPPP